MASFFDGEFWDGEFFDGEVWRGSDAIVTIVVLGYAVVEYGTSVEEDAADVFATLEYPGIRVEEDSH